MRPTLRVRGGRHEQGMRYGRASVLATTVPPELFDAVGLTNELRLVKKKNELVLINLQDSV